MRVDPVKIVSTRDPAIIECSGLNGELYGYGIDISHSHLQSGSTNPKVIDRGVDFSANPNVKIVNSILIGGVRNDAQGAQCLAVYDNDLAPIDC